MARAQKKSKKQRKFKRSDKARKSAARGSDWLYGRHAVFAALANPQRKILEVRATRNAFKDFKTEADKRNISILPADGDEISALLPAGAVHQGIAIKTQPLEEKKLADLPPHRPVIILDQVTDPHNVGAILRSAAAFDASALIMTRRNSPPLSGVLAKSACGGLEHVAVVFVGNLAQTLKELGKAGFWRIGLEGSATDALENHVRQIDKGCPLALVLGAEDKGMRRLTMENCDRLCHISTRGSLVSLNVSNAAAIALHVVSENRN